MKSESIEVLIQANADQFRREVADVNKKLDTMGKTASSSSAMSGKSMVKMGAVAGAVGAIVAKGVDVALRAMKQLSIGSVKMAMEAVESESLVAVVFGEMTGDITAWSNELSQKLGLNAYAVRRSAGVFYNIADALGVSGENAMTLSKGIVSLSNDMASFYNISTEEAILKLRAGITGETEPLKQLGIIVTENTVKDTAYKYGIAQVGEELSNQQKVLGRYMTIMDQTSTAQGDLARTIESPANQLRILKARWEQLSITLGSIFIPILNKVLPYIQAFVSLISLAIQAVGQLFGVTGIKAVGTAKKLTTGFEGVGGASNVAAKGVKALKKELAGLASFDEMNVLKVPEAGAGGSDGGGVGGIGGGTDFKLPEYDLGLENIKNKADEIYKNWLEKWKQIKAVIQSVKTWIETYIVKPLVDFYNNTLKPVFEFLWGAIKLMLIPQLEALKNKFLDMFKYIGVNGEDVKRFIEYLAIGFGVTIVGAITAIIWALSTLVAAINVILSVTKFVVKGAIYSWGTFLVVVDMISDMSNQATEGFKKMGESIKAYFGGIGTFISGVFAGNWSKAWTGIKTTFSNIWATMTSGLKLNINVWISVLNAFIRGLNKLQIPSIFGSKPVGINIGQVPYLAQGGVVSSPTLAMMGEGGYKEAVLPLDRNTGWAKEVADLIGNSSGDKNINLVVKIGDDTIFEKTIKYINDKSLRTGSTILNI